jgi:hypothetical protein
MNNSPEKELVSWLRRSPEPSTGHHGERGAVVGLHLFETDVDGRRDAPRLGESRHARAVAWL